MRSSSNLLTAAEVAVASEDPIFVCASLHGEDPDADGEGPQVKTAQEQALIQAAEAEAAQIRRQAEAEAERVCAQAAQEAERICEEARQEGWTQGYAAGQQAAAEELQAQVARWSAETHAYLDRWQQDWSEQLVALLFALLQRWAGSVPQAQQLLLAETLRECVATLGQMADCTFWVAPASYPQAKALIEGWAKETGSPLVRLLPDLQMEPGTVRVTSGRGVVESSAAQRLQELQALLQQEVGRGD
ncbi:MAG: hypothetical protein IMW91_00150 [Firmicutes bacterium]|nr:hypothetical protein [Bacillota bacterium]